MTFCNAFATVLGCTLLLAASDAPGVLDDAPEAAAAEAVEAEEQFRVGDSTFDDSVFRNGRNAAAVQFRLDVLLRRKVEEIAALCGTSEAQQQKLLLAGRGDIKRFLDRAEELRKKFEVARPDRDKLAVFQQDELFPLRRSLESGLFGAGSIFAKSLVGILTPEQATRYERALRERPKPSATADQPALADVYHRRAGQHQTNKRYAEALADLSQAIEIDPGFIAAYFCRSSIYSSHPSLGQRDYAKAAADLTVCLQIAPTDYSARFNRALAYESLREYDKAIDDYTQVIEGETDFSRYGNGKAKGLAHALHYRGRAYQWYKQDYTSAVADFTAALRLDPKIEMVHYRRGQAYHELKEYGKAQDDFARALELDPGYSNLLDSWAWQLATCPDGEFRNGRKALELATRSYEKARSQRPETLESLAAAHAELGAFDEAVKWQRKAIDSPGLRSDELRTTMQARLDLYESSRPFRTE